MYGFSWPPGWTRSGHYNCPLPLATTQLDVPRQPGSAQLGKTALPGGSLLLSGVLGFEVVGGGCMGVDLWCLSYSFFSLSACMICMLKVSRWCEYRKSK